MARLKDFLRWLSQREYFWLCLLVVVTLVLHFILIAQPAEPVFDELHYIPDAQRILEGEGSLRTEHPPLGKLLVASGILLFGDNPLGWRFFSVVCGTASIVLFYLICRRLKLSRRQASLATFLLALENLTFIQASLAMLDVFSLTFMMLCFWLYLRGDYLCAGAAAALAALVKLTGVFVLPAIGLHWLLVRRDHPIQFVSSMLLSGLTFFLLLPQFNYAIFHFFINPIDDIKNMLGASSSLTFANTDHPCQSRPWEWVILPLIMPYWYQPHYIGVISFNIWALIIPAMAYMIWLAWRGRGRDAALFALAWFAGTYLIWIPISLITDRVSYIYYFYPTIGAVCLALGMGLNHLLELRLARPGRKGKIIKGAVIGFLVLHFLVFAGLSPLFPMWWVS